MSIYFGLYISDVYLDTSPDEGDSVVAGGFIGPMGSSGQSTGPHLHLQVYDSHGATFQAGNELSNTQDPVSLYGGEECVAVGG